jgi:hypothetical protein
MGRNCGASGVCSETDAVDIRVILQSTKTGNPISVLIPNEGSFQQRLCRTSEKSKLLAWFDSVKSAAWGCVDHSHPKNGPENIFLILGQTMTTECWISHLPSKSTCSIRFENLIHRLTLPSTTRPWIAYDLFPIGPGKGFKKFGGSSIPVSIFIDIVDASRPQSGSEELGLEFIHPAAIADAPRAGDFDIVFVHGLGGSARRTWTHPESRWFWPRGLVDKKGFQNARVLTFGYFSDWTKGLGPQSRLDLRDYALQLLDRLDLHRRENGEVWEFCYTLTVRNLRFLWRTAWGD